MELDYINYTNLDARFLRVYEPGDRLVRGHSGHVWIEPDEGLGAAAEQVFIRHNRDDRPDGQLCPSLSVGDVVVFGEVALSIASTGFLRVDLNANDLILDRTWRQAHTEEQLAPDTADGQTGLGL